MWIKFVKKMNEQVLNKESIERGKVLRLKDWKGTAKELILLIKVTNEWDTNIKNVYF